MKRIVLLGDHLTTLGAAWCLRQFKPTLVRAADEESLACHSRWVGSVHTLPERSWEKAAPRLRALNATSRGMILLPCSDIWLQFLGKYWDDLKLVARMLPEGKESLRLTLDKIFFFETLDRLGLPAPAIYSWNPSADWRPSTFPFVLKPAFTFELQERHGAKALSVHGPEDWARLDRRLFQEQRFLAQELVGGHSLSVCFCCASDGGLAAAYTTEKVHFLPLRAGCRVRTIHAPGLISLVETFVNRTGFRGFGEMEFIQSERGPLFVELNARPWSQVIMSEALDRPILRLAVQIMEGQRVEALPAARVPDLEWLMWDQDLLFRRAMRRRGKPCRPLSPMPRIYGVSAARDFWPAVHYCLKYSRLGPGRFRKRKR